MMLAFLVALSVCALVTPFLIARLAGKGVARFVVMHRKLADSDLASQFVFLDGRVLAASSAMVGLILGGLLLLAGIPWHACAGGLVLGLLGPKFTIRAMANRRRQRLYEQLPDALGFWAGLLASGHSLHASLAQMSERQARPLGDELRLLVRKSRLGVPIEEGMNDLCRRLGVQDLTLVATLLRVSRELGGNLAESLQRLSDVLRERLATEARIRSLTAQGRLQGWIVGVLPLLLLAVLSAMEPEAMSVLFRKPIGWSALALIAFLEAVGFILIRKIVSIEV